MSIWVWLSRVTLFGLVGTTAIATLFFSTLKKPNNTADRIQAATISPEEIQALNFSAPPTPTPPITEQQPLIQRQPLPERQPLIQRQPLTERQPLIQRQPLTERQPRSVKKNEGSPKIIAHPFNLQQSLATYSRLFTTPTSLGMVAIGVAEGNYRLVVKKGTLYVQQTPTYFGHADPGNLSWGDVVTNYGPCSDQGRSGGNMALAEQLCLQRSRDALPTQLVDLNTAGIHPDQDIEALLNVADLYNQASPIHSRHFPKALAIARRGGLRGIESLAWARTASFYLNSNNELDLERGSNQASGLLGICVRENRPTTEWQCVYDDQMRRVKAISNVLEQYRRLAQKKS